MMKIYENLCQMLEKEIKTIEQQSSALTKDNLELLKCITETLSNIKMIMKAEEEKKIQTENSLAYNSMMSNAQRRDSMGRYMDYNPRYMMPEMEMEHSYRQGNSNNSYTRGDNGNNSYVRGNSYDNSIRNSRDYNSYSRDDSRKKMVRKLETLMDDTMSDKERQAIQDCINRIDL